MSINLKSSGCHCAGCEVTYANLTLFDAHQSWTYGRPARLSCRTPEALGLVLGPNDTWWTPEGLKSSTRRVAAMRAAKR